MRFLYLTCLVSEKEKFDGERIKNSLIYSSLKKMGEVDVIDFTSHKLLNVFRTFFKGAFRKRKYDYFVISKDPHGANIIQKILNFTKVPSDKIYYFEIGPFLYDRINNGSIKKETFMNEKLIIVETASMKRELLSLGFERVDVFPNFKPIINVPFEEQKYPKKELNLVFLSRIEDKKGIYDLIECIKELNEKDVKFKLDVYGRPQNSEEEAKILKLSSELDYISYKGKIDLNNEAAYKVLSAYDLHVFPTKYPEGFPGSIIDFFMAGVPTLSSTFARANDILTERDSILFKQGDRKDLINKLKYIYDNQHILVSLRKSSYDRRNEFSVESFEKYLESLFKR